MNQKELVDEVQKIAEEIIDKRYQKSYKALITENYLKFLDNERNFSDKEKLLKILKKVKWYSNHNTDIFFFNIISEILDNTIGDIYCLCKKKITSSCYSIVTNLLVEGKIEKKNVIFYNKEELEYNEVKENDTVLIMDDYSGSGSTIIEMIGKIEEKFSDINVLIVIYVWQTKAIENIKNYLKKDLKNNYKIIEKGIVLEDSYKERFINDNDSITYIQSVCEDCQHEDYKYGYKQTGAMITFNGISPNNNISMLWNNNIKHNDLRWFPIFNREYSLELLRKKKNDYLRKNKSEINDIYQKSFLKNRIEYKEFEVLIILFNIYSIRKEYIKESLGFDSTEDVIKIIEKFIECGIITYSTENILEFIDRRVIDEMKKIDERISESVGIIKGTRKQIDKITPLD